MTDDPMMTDPLLRPWRSHQRLAVLRLRVDVVGASRVPVRRAGQLVYARWWGGHAPFAEGWMIDGIGFPQILNEPDVEIIEKP